MHPAALVNRIDHFELLARVGTGGMSIVYPARDGQDATFAAMRAPLV